MPLPILMLLDRFLLGDALWREFYALYSGIVCLINRNTFKLNL